MSNFIPEEIIFCPTSLCNLKCNHCFVCQKNEVLDSGDAVAFLKDCAKKSQISRVGFSGGEPFLNLDFVLEICKCARKFDFEFDRLMTNGAWWKSREELKLKLESVYDSGFDGKIGLSWDKFHGQKADKIVEFLLVCKEVFGSLNCVEILSVVDSSCIKKDCSDFYKQLKEICAEFNLKMKKQINRTTGCGEILLFDKFFENNLRIYRFEQSFMPDKNIKFKDKKWFTEDYCQNTGNVLYVHANGNIAPCCGFANECEKLLIGNIKDSFEQIMKNAESNFMVNLCYDRGLLEYAKNLQKKKILPKGKCSDMCGFCAWVAEN